MAESSDKNPEKTFNFQLNPAIKLKQSIESLKDHEFNPKGVGRIDISEKGFEITVINSETNVGGYLFLKSSGLINFHCSKSIGNKLINLNLTSLFLVSSTDDDTITIYHVVGSKNLTFIIGSAPNKVMKIEFLEMNFEFDKFPDIIFFCEAVITTDLLRQMIQKLEETGKTQQVSVDITEKLVAILVGGKDPWIYKYDTDKIVGTRGLEPGQQHHAWFILQHLEAMKKAANLAPCLLICFLTEPPNFVMMRFNLRELGDLAFIIEASKIFQNADDLLRHGGAQEIAMQPV
ncbi:Proliferating cell nuclear antigen [Bienertia sinuspersici]